MSNLFDPLHLPLTGLPVPGLIVAALGPELLTDGDMEAAGVGDWSSGFTTLSKEITNPHSGTRLMRSTATAAGGFRNPQFFQTILTAGKRYRCVGWMRSDGTETPTVRDDGGTKFTGTTSTSWQPVDFEWVATGASLVLAFTINNPAGTEYCEFDDFSVKEII